MTTAEFNIRPIPERDRPERTAGRSVSRGYVNGVPFLLIVTMPTTYTLAWQARLDFNHLERQVFLELPRALWPRSVTRPIRWPSFSIIWPWWISGSARLVVAYNDGRDDNVDLLRFDNIRSLRYRRVIRQQRIAFARFDLKFIDKHVEPQSYSFAAANHEYYPSRPIVSLKLDRGHTTTPELWNWIWPGSEIGQELGSELDSTTVTHQLESLLRQTA